MSIKKYIYIAWLFLKRGLLSMLSYRTALLLSLFSGFLGVIQFSLMARFVLSENSFPLIQQYERLEIYPYLHYD